MTTILNPDFENSTIWVLGRTGYGFAVPVYSTDWAHSGSQSMKFKMTCSDVGAHDVSFIQQSITVQNNHKIHYRVRTVDQHIESFHDVYFRVLFDGNILHNWSDPPGNFDVSVYCCHSPPGWVTRECGADTWHQNIDLSSYAGQTGQLRFEFYRNDPDNYTLDHLFESYIYLDAITEQYTTITDFYVKTAGNDALSGQSWVNAWETINKAATTVADGATVHIGFGDYTDEPASNKIAPQNAGALGIEYRCETTGSSGGVGTVKIEKN